MVDNQTVLDVLGWAFVVSVVGSYLIWLWEDKVRRPKRERIEAEWEAARAWLEPNSEAASRRVIQGDMPYLAAHDTDQAMWERMRKSRST